MKQFKTIQTEKQVLDHIICNCCGQEIRMTEQHPYPDYLSIHKTWGYDSPFDGEEHEIDLCPTCYEKWIQTFQIDPRRGEESQDV